MSMLRHALSHLAFEGLKETTRYLTSSEFQRDAKNACGGLNRVRAEISKTIGTEKCSYCGKKIQAYDSVTTDYKASYCSRCRPLQRRFY